MRTSTICERLRDPLGYFNYIPNAVALLFDLWAERLEDEVTPVDFVTSYFALLQDLQDGLDSRTGDPLLHPLAGRPPADYRPFFIMFPHLIPWLLEDQAEEVAEAWRRTLDAVRP